MPPGKRKSSSSPGARPPAPAAPIFPLPSSGAPRFVACPTCGKSFAFAFVQNHAWNCGATIDSCHEGETTTTVVKRCSLQNGGKKGLNKFVECPTCGESFPQHAIEHHAWGCQPQKQQRHDEKEDGTNIAAVLVKGCEQEPARCLPNAESEHAAKDVVKTSATEGAPGWRAETSSQLESRHMTVSPVCTFPTEGRCVTTATVRSPETKPSRGACGGESGKQPREYSPDDQPRDVVQASHQALVSSIFCWGWHVLLLPPHSHAHFLLLFCLFWHWLDKFKFVSFSRLDCRN